MQSRNVIFSLAVVLALLIFIFIRIRFIEPKRKLTFNRNPSRIEYAQLALCRMACYHFSANDITEILKNGEVNFSKSDIHARPCPIFAIRGITKKGKILGLLVAQCGRIAKIKSCDNMTVMNQCDCPVNQSEGISLLKISY
jgi:hypothetical protein